jgi:MFS family permease
MTKKPVSTSVSLGVFFLGSMLLWADRTNFSVAAAVWAKEYDWTPTLLGSLLSAFTLGYLLMTPFGGWIADRIGPRRTTAMACAGWSVWVLVTPFVVTVQPLLAVIRALLGVFEAPYLPSNVVVVAKAFPSENKRALPMAFLNCASYLGPALGVYFAATILGVTKSPVMVFVIFAAIGFVLSGAWWLYAMRRSDPAPSAAAAETAEAKARAADLPLPLKSLLFRGTLWPLFLAFLAVPYCNYIFLTWLPQYLTRYRHLPVVQAGQLSSIPYFAAAVALIASGFCMNWFARKGWKGGRLAAHRKLPVYIGAVVFAISISIAATTDSTTTAVVMITAGVCGLAMYSVGFFPIVTDIAPNQAGLVYGLMSCCGLIGGFLSPIVSGIVAERTGTFVAPLQIAVVIIIIGAFLMMFVRLRPLSEQAGLPAVAAVA